VKSTAPNSGARRAGLRHGTALRRAGRETSKRIIEAARAVLSEEGYTRFSLRNIANQAEITLANLQYYFPKRDDLLRALIEDLDERYLEGYHAAMDGVGDDPQEQFNAVLRYNLEDIVNPETRRFFIQLWGLFNTIDDCSGEKLSELYAIDIEQLGGFIAALEPSVSIDEIQLRATLLAGMIEGLMIVLGSQKADDDKTRAILERAFHQGLAISKGIF